jgi:hypothetical protein
MSMVAGQLFPVSGTPQANAAYCTPGIAATRSNACRWNGSQSSGALHLSNAHRQNVGSCYTPTAPRRSSPWCESAGPRQRAMPGSSEVCSMVTPRSSRRSPIPAVPFGPASLSTLHRIQSKGAERRNRCCKNAANTANPSPQPKTAQPAVTPSRRGTACPAINLKSFTAPMASPTPRAPPTNASSKAFSQNLPQKTDAAHAHGDAHSVFLLPLQSAHQQQSGSVAASNQQHQRRGAQQRQ